MNALYTYKAKVVRVIDGDTFVADIDLGFSTWVRKTIRILGIDAPEKTGPTKEAGINSMMYLGRLIDGPDAGLVTVCTEKPDSFGRALADVWLEDGQSVAGIMVANGYAVAKAP